MIDLAYTYTVVVPVYNEVHALQEALSTLGQVLSEHYADNVYELITVDDGSGDGSAAILEQVQADMPHLRVLSHPTNCGYGAALKTGIRHARHEVIIITDADGTYPPERIPDLIDYIEAGYDMVVGARTKDEAHIPLIRRPAKWMIRKLASYLTETQIPDLNSGLRAIRKPCIYKFWSLLPNGFSFTTTITLALLSNNYPVKYVPIAYHKRGGKSKIKPIQDTLNFIQLVIRTSMYFNPLKVFLPLSLFFISLSVLIGVLSRVLTGQVMDVISVVIFVTGVQIMITGMLADLIDKRTQGTEYIPPVSESEEDYEHTP